MVWSMIMAGKWLFSPLDPLPMIRAEMFPHNHHTQLQLVVLTKHGETGADLRNFILSHGTHLPISNSVSEQNSKILSGRVWFSTWYFLRITCKHSFSPSIISWSGLWGNWKSANTSQSWQARGKMGVMSRTVKFYIWWCQKWALYAKICGQAQNSLLLDPVQFNN